MVRLDAQLISTTLTAGVVILVSRFLLKLFRARTPFYRYKKNGLVQSKLSPLYVEQ